VPVLEIRDGPSEIFEDVRGTKPDQKQTGLKVVHPVLLKIVKLHDRKRDVPPACENIHETVSLRQQARYRAGQAGLATGV
jgi:hypothetical protein